MERRLCARLVNLDPEPRLLQFGYHDEPFGATVGGVLVGDERYPVAVRRERFAKTGFVAPIGHFLKGQVVQFVIAGSTSAL